METLTSGDIFRIFAPSFNFEYNEEELLKIALERGFITKMENEENLYLVNEEYGK